MGTHVCEHELVVTHAHWVHAHKQNAYRACVSFRFDTLQTYMHVNTPETWLKGIENTHIILDAAPRGSCCTLLLGEAGIYGGILA